MLREAKASPRRITRPATAVHALNGKDATPATPAFGPKTSEVVTPKAAHIAEVPGSHPSKTVNRCARCNTTKNLRPSRLRLFFFSDTVLFHICNSCLQHRFAAHKKFVKRVLIPCLLVSSLGGCAASQEHQVDGGTLVYESITPGQPNQSGDGGKGLETPLLDKLAKVDLSSFAYAFPATIRAFTSPESFPIESVLALGYPLADLLNGPTKQRLAQIEAERGATVKRAYLPLHASEITITDDKLSVVAKSGTK